MLPGDARDETCVIDAPSTRVLLSRLHPCRADLLFTGQRQITPSLPLLKRLDPPIPTRMPNPAASETVLPRTSCEFNAMPIA